MIDRLANVFVLACLLWMSCSTQASAKQLPLFASDTPLQLTLELPLQTLVKQAAERPLLAGRLSYSGGDDREISFPIRISTRGNSRLQECRFPPLSVVLKKKQVAGTLFEGQKKLKLVTHCASTTMFAQYLLQEYSIYRAFRVLTDTSFRVRLVDVTYVDTERPGHTIDARAFFIESIGEVADRLQLRQQKTPAIGVAQLDADYATRTALFHFMIGNTDWSMLLGQNDSNCCHNGRVLSRAGEQSGWVVVPYDFDQAGLINTRYASPSETLPINSVRQRLYRGRCIHREHLNGAVALFNERREQIESMLLPEGLMKRRIRSVRAYISSFYRIVNNPERLNAYADKGCLAG